MGHALTTRADRIASYEVSRAQGFADEAWTQSGVVSEKEWYSALDERVCPGCNRMHGRTIGLSVNYFDKGDRLSVDRGEGKTPYRFKLDYEDVPACPLHNKCRCCILPVRS